MGACRGKIRYRDRVGALIALASTGRKTSARRNESRAYRCPDCKGWHLTSHARQEKPRG